MRLRAMSTLLAGLLVSGSSYAQQAPGGGQFTPPPDDPSLTLLREIFGNLVDYVTGGAAAGDLASNGTVMAAGFEIFNVAVLFLGMIFVGYTTIMGVINTAHDGEFLGRKMSSIWVPLRTFAGSALLLPLAGGYSAIQIVVMWLAVQGVGMGDKVWTAMLTRVDQGGMIGHPNIPDARPLAANVFRFEVCRAAMNKQYAESGSSDRVTVKAVQRNIESWVPTNEPKPGDIPVPGPLTNTGYTKVNIPVTSWYWTANGYIGNTVCGGLNWEESPQSQEGNARYLDLSGIYKAHTAAVSDMINSLRPIAESVVAGQKPAAGSIEQAAYAYELKLQQASRSAVDASNQSGRAAFVDFAKTGGWIHAGAYYNHIIQLNDAVQLSVNAMPSSNSIDIDSKETEDALIGYRDAMVVAEEFLKQRADSAHQAYNAELDAEACLDPLPTSWDAVKRCLSKPATWGIEQMTQEMAGSNTSHVAQVKNIGDTIMTAGWAIIGVSALGNGLADSKASEWTIGLGFNIGSALQSLGGLLTFLVVAILAAGMAMAFYVPMIPFIAWITGIIKWVVSVTEALIAAPIFAAAHIHPDGDDSIGRAGPGYMIILSMICRPVLMLFGLLASIAVAQPIAHLVNSLFMLAVKGAMHDSANGIGAFVAYCVIYAIIMTTVLHAVFSLIHFIPDNGLRFMGNAVGMHGIADSEEGESHRVFIGAADRARGATTLGGRGSHGSGNGGGGGGGERPPSSGTTQDHHAQTPNRGGGGGDGGGM